MKRNQMKEDKDCWFCFDNPSIERNLIIKETPNFYIALPKGPIIDDHFLIVPKTHIAHSIELTEEQEQEMLKLKGMVLDHLKNKDYIVFERNMPFSFQKAAHMNLQIVGLDSDSNLEERVAKLIKTFGKQ